MYRKLKRGPRWPPFIYGRGRLLPFLAGLLLPALGFLRHCLLSPPSCWDIARARPRITVAAAWHARPMSALYAFRHLPSVAGERASSVELAKLTRDGLSRPPSYQM